MKTCCCQLAGTKACDNCGNVLTVGNVTSISPPNNGWIPNTFWIENKPLNFNNIMNNLMNNKKLSDYTVDELLNELKSRTNVFVNKVNVDDSMDVVSIVIKSNIKL